MFNYDDEYTYESRPPYRRSAMATAAIALGLLSLLLCSVIYVSLPCGAMAVICAILSRGKGKMTGRSKVGLIFGVAGMIATVVITISAFVYVLTTDSGRNYLEYYYRIYSGDFDFDLDDALEEYFPFLFGSEDDSSNSSQENGTGNSIDDGSNDSGEKNSDNNGSSGSDSNGSGGSGSGNDSDSGGGNSGGDNSNGSGGDSDNGGSRGSNSAEGGFI